MPHRPNLHNVSDCRLLSFQDDQVRKQGCVIVVALALDLSRTELQVPHAGKLAQSTIGDGRKHTPLLHAKSIKYSPDRPPSVQQHLVKPRHQGYRVAV